MYSIDTLANKNLVHMFKYNNLYQLVWDEVTFPDLSGALLASTTQLFILTHHCGNSNFGGKIKVITYLKINIFQECFLFARNLRRRIKFRSLAVATVWWPHRNPSHISTQPKWRGHNDRCAQRKRCEFRSKAELFHARDRH